MLSDKVRKRATGFVNSQHYVVYQDVLRDRIEFLKESLCLQEVEREIRRLQGAIRELKKLLKIRDLVNGSFK